MKKYIILVLMWLFCPESIIGKIIYKRTKNTLATTIIIMYVFVLHCNFMFVILFWNIQVNDHVYISEIKTPVIAQEKTPIPSKTKEKTLIPTKTKIRKTETLSQRNAVKAAKNYINIIAFSRSGLIKQLKYEGYSNNDSNYAVNKLKINYSEQAFKCAENYLNIMAFSRSGLIRQLRYEGYTPKEAIYAVDKVGLF